MPRARGVGWRRQTKFALIGGVGCLESLAQGEEALLVVVISPSFVESKKSGSHSGSMYVTTHA